MKWLLVKLKICIIALDIFRAYEFVKMNIIEEYIEKKINKYKGKKEKNKDKTIACNLIKIWLILIKNCNTELNNNLIKNRQGTPMGSKWSPKIFDLYVGLIYKDLLYSKDHEKKFWIVQFCDDVILKIKWNFIDEIINKIEKNYKKYNMKINYGKSEILIDKNINNYTIEHLDEIINIKEKYKFKTTENLRYLGKWLAEKKTIIKSGKDELKDIGSNIYFNDLVWDAKIQYIHAYIISKRRYLITNEKDITIIKKYLKEINLKIRNLKIKKQNTYLELLLMMNFFGIIIRKRLGDKEYLRLNILDVIRQFIKLIKELGNYENSEIGQTLKIIKKWKKEIII